MATCLRRRAVRRGEILFREGDVGDTMFFIEEGAVRVLQREPSRAQRALTELSAGDVLGEMACIDPSARSATALALRDTSALVLNRDALNALRAHAPPLAQAVFGAAARALAARLGEAHARIVARVGPSPRAASGIVPKQDVAAAPTAVPSRVAAWFRRSAS
ncbi:MAG: cyclic nucleotide-binding domain-containing protein [Polyangiales bacterium]